MRKKLSLLLLILLIPALAYAWGVMIVGGNVPAGGAQYTLGPTTPMTGSYENTTQIRITGWTYSGTNFTLNKGYFYCNENCTKKFKLAVYDGDGTDAVNLMDISTEGTCTGSAEWITVTFDDGDTIADSNDYWLAYWPAEEQYYYYGDPAGEIDINYDGSGASYSTWPDPWEKATQGNTSRGSNVYVSNQ